jgi:hypothetical protein
MAGGAELAGIALRTHYGEEIFVSIPQPFGMVILETVDLFEEHIEGVGIAKGEKGVLEDIAEEFGKVGVSSHTFQAFGIEVHSFLPGKAGIDDIIPGEPFIVADEIGGFSSNIDRSFIGIVHEFVDKGKGDLFYLRFGVGNLADQNLTGSIDLSFGCRI